MPYDPNIIKNREYDAFNIDNLGIISTFFHLFNLIDFVDTLLPKSRDQKVSPGESFLFLSLLSFALDQRTSYNMTDILRHAPIFLFFKRDIDINDFNDDALGRFFEAINNYGTSAFFLRIVHHLSSQLPELIKFDKLHTNIANFTVYDEFLDFLPDDSSDKILKIFKIVHGHSEDKINYLEYLSLGLITNSLGAPVFIKPLSGNCSDNKDLNLLIREFATLNKQLFLDNLSSIYIADADFYSEKNITDFPTYFITRVPETIDECKQLKYSNVTMTTFNDDPRYSFHLTTSHYAGIEQHWLLVHSTEMDIKQRATFERRLENELAASASALKILETRSFTNAQDARKGAEFWISKRKRLKFEALEIVEETKSINKKKGRPKTSDIVDKSFFIRGKLCFNTELIEKEKLSLGRFVLATTQLQLTPLDILKYYKEKSKVENCLRFIQSNDLWFSEALLKNMERIQGLGCFISLITLISSVLELMLRDGLKRNCTTIKGYFNKQTNKPTLNFAFEKFRYFSGILVYDKESNSVKCSISTNRRSDMTTILEALGNQFYQFYNYNLDYIPLEKATFLLRNICYVGSD
jgi:transposase